MVARTMMMAWFRALPLALLLAVPAVAHGGDKEEVAPDLPFELTAPETAPAAPAATPATEVEAPAVATGEEAIRLLSQALDRISALQLLLGNIEGVDQARALVELDEARQSLQSALIEVGRLQQDTELRVWLRSEGLVAPPVAADEAAIPGEESPAPPAGLAPDTFRALVAAIESVSFTEGKMDVLTRELATDTVTSNQASRLVKLFSFSRDRVDALVFLHSRIVDVENFDSLLSALKFESDRETVRNQLGLDG